MSLHSSASLNTKNFPFPNEPGMNVAECMQPAVRVTTTCCGMSPVSQHSGRGNHSCFWWFEFTLQKETSSLFSQAVICTDFKCKVLRVKTNDCTYITFVSKEKGHVLDYLALSVISLKSLALVLDMDELLWNSPCQQQRIALGRALSAPTGHISYLGLKITGNAIGMVLSYFLSNH